MPLENWPFCIRYFSKMKRKSTKTVTERCFSCQNKSVYQILVRSWKNENRPKKRYTPFLHETLQLLIILTSTWFCFLSKPLLITILKNASWSSPRAIISLGGSALSLKLCKIIVSLSFLCGISHTLSTPAIFIYLSRRAKRLSRVFYLACRLGSTGKRLSVFVQRPLVWFLLAGVVFWWILTCFWDSEGVLGLRS